MENYTFTSKELENYSEICRSFWGFENLKDDDKRSFFEYAAHWAKEFEQVHGETDWDQNDYYKTIEGFTHDRAVKAGFIDEDFEPEEETLIVAWMTGEAHNEASLKSDYNVYIDEKEEAEKFYKELLEKDDLYSASICKVIESTDY